MGALLRDQSVPIHDLVDVRLQLGQLQSKAREAVEGATTNWESSNLNQNLLYVKHKTSINK